MMLLVGCGDTYRVGFDSGTPTGDDDDTTSDDDDDTTGDDDDDSAGIDARATADARAIVDASTVIDASNTVDAGDTDPLSINSGGSRIKMRIGTTPDGARALLGWRDTLNGDDCYFGVAADGQQRCLPMGQHAYINGFFSDSGCTLPLAVLATSDCSTQPTPKYAYDFQPICNSNVSAPHFHLVTALHSGTVYYGTPTSCSVWTSSGYLFYDIGPELPATTFQVAAETLE
jgi:hypothetical protein